MTSHITQCTGSIIPPSPPFERQVLWAVMFVGNWPLPEIPVECVGNRTGAFWLGSSRRPNRPVGPAQSFGHISDHSRPTPLSQVADTVAGTTSVSHSGDQILTLRVF